MTDDQTTPLPPSFIDLSTAYRQLDKAANVIGVCVDFLPSTKSRGTDYTIKFTLHDPECCLSIGVGMQFQFFHGEEKKLPSIQNVGDVLIIRNVKTKIYRGQQGGLSNSSTSWAVLSGPEVLKSTCPQGSDIKFEKSGLASCPSVAELAYAKFIAKLENPNMFVPPPKPTALQVASIISANGGTPQPTNGRYSLVQDLVVSKFSDLVGEVVRIYSNDYHVEMSITDYTSHPQLFNYTHEMDETGPEGDLFRYTAVADKKWQGPLGRMSLAVTLWDANASFARQNVREGDYVKLRNVQIKLDRHGGKLEGHCRGDRMFPDRVNVLTIKARDAVGDSQMLELLRRKREYASTAKMQSERSGEQNRASRYCVESGIDVDRKQPRPKMTKSQRRKEKKADNQAIRRIPGRSDGEQNDTTSVDLRTVTNTQVRCKGFPVPLKMIDEILDADILKSVTPNGNDFHLPFQNCRYKSKVRVVDYFPDSIADFAVPHRVSEYEMLSEYESDGDTCPEPTQVHSPDVNWEWRFFLLVEDANASNTFGCTPRQMELLVTNTDGEFLLDMKPCDLRGKPDQLNILREKLFILWGNLEEMKETANAAGDEVDLNQVRGRPFDCFIKEYGIKERGTRAAGWERMFRLFDTNIKGA